MAAFGLHFGTCSGCVAVYKDGRTDVVANDLGDRVTPAVVAFTDHEVSVGAAAKQGIIRNASNTISFVKKLIGCKMGDPQIKEYKELSSVNVVDISGSPGFEIEHKGKTVRVTPSDITARIYGKLLETAKSSGGSGSQDAVLAVPSEFTDTQRAAISGSAKKAGFNILRVINQPSAALLAFDVGQLDQTEHLKTIVYRLGGTSHDATVVEVEHGMYRTVATVSDSQFGANMFTDKLQSFLASEFKRQARCDIGDNKRAKMKLSLAAERCKHSLSTMISAQCAVESLYEGMDFHYNMSRARFESLIQPLISKCTELIDQALAQAGCVKEDISKVIICGGGAKPPMVKKIIGEYMGSSTLLNSIPEDEIIALGAAKEAALLVGDNKSSSIDQETSVNFSFLPKSVCLKLSSEELEVVLPQHMLAPARRQHTLTLPAANTSVSMEIFQADDPPVLDTAQLLAKVILRDLPPGSTIKSNFHLKREGDLHVTCHEVTSDKSASVTIPCH